MPPDMPAAKLRPVSPEDDGVAAGHVLAAVVAHALRRRRWRRSCGRRTARRCGRAGRARRRSRRRRWCCRRWWSTRRRWSAPRSGRTIDPAAGQALADVVVGVALQAQRDAARAAKAPKDWPAEPVKVMSMVSSGRPAPPNFLVTSWPSMVPTVRLMLRIGDLGADRLAPRSTPASRASAASLISSLSSAFSRPWSCAVDLVAGRALGQLGHVEAAGRGPGPAPSSGRRPRLGVEELGVADGLLERCGSPARRGARGPLRR